MDAYRHLAEWPTSFSDTAHSVALKACQAALHGDIEAETAPGLFAAFAAMHDLLAPETPAIAAFRMRRDRDPHVQCGDVMENAILQQAIEYAGTIGPSY